MKKLLYSGSTFLLLVLILVRCSNDQQDNKINLERNNPYDYIGLRHNEGLDYIAKNYKQGGEEEVYNLIDEYGSSKTSSSLSGYPFILLNGLKIKYQTHVDEYPSAKNYIDANQQKYKPLDRKYFYEIADVIDHFIEKHQDFNKFRGLIAVIEAQIINDRQDVTKPLLLGMTSIAIYSAKYWYDYHTNSDNLYRNIKPLPEVESRIILDYCTLVDCLAYGNTYNDFYYGYGYSEAYSQQMAWNQATYSSARCTGGF